MKALSHIIILLLVCNILYACAEKKIEKTEGGNYTPAYTSDQLFDRLKHYIDDDRKDSLDHFFKEWNTAIKPNMNEYINRNDTLRAIHDIFSVVYRPLNLIDLGDTEWGNRQNEGCKYIVVQNSINYIVLYEKDDKNLLDHPGSGLVVDDFRPKVNVDTEKVLYLSPEYREALTKLLGIEHSEVGEGDIMNPAYPKGKTRNYYRIIRPYIPLLIGHWGNNWHIETHPHIYTIAFDKDMSKATVFFRIGYQGGSAELENKNGNWIMIRSQMTWIE